MRHPRIHFREDWKPRPLKYLLSRNDSGVWGEDPVDGGGTPVVRSTDIELNGSWNLKDVAVRQLPSRDRHEGVLRKGDLVVVKSSGSRQHLGKAALVSDEVEELGACFANFVQRVRTSPEADPKYVWYLLNSVGREEMFFLSNTTTGLQNLNGEIIGRVMHPGAALHEQRTIADFLDRETGRIDTLVEKRSILITLLKKRRQALISAAVIGRLDSRIGLDDDERETWETVPLKRMGRVAYGLGQPPPSSEDGVPIIRATNIQRGRIRDNDLVRARLADIPLQRAPLLEEGEILVVRSGAYTGDSALITKDWVGSAPGYDLRLTPYPQSHPPFLAYQLLADHALHQIDLERSRAAQPHLNAEELGGIEVFRVANSAQTKIADYLHHFTSRLDELLLMEQRFIGLAKEHRQALITAAVTGQLKVSEAA